MTHQRSTAYPLFSLQAALRILREDLGAMGSAPISRERLGRLLGFQTASGGAAGRTIACLAQFGLLQRRADSFALSALGLQLQRLREGDPEHAAALGLACREPRLFRTLLDKFEPKGRLPDDLGPDLELIGIKPHAVENAARVFRGSVLFAGVVGPDGRFRVIREEKPQPSAAAPSVQEPLGASGATLGLSEAPTFEVQLMLPGKREGKLVLPANVRLEELDDIRDGFEAALLTLRVRLRPRRPAESTAASRKKPVTTKDDNVRPFSNR